MTRKIEVQRPYRHFKGKLYYVHNIVTHTETEEVLVSYQALYPTIWDVCQTSWYVYGRSWRWKRRQYNKSKI